MSGAPNSERRLEPVEAFEPLTPAPRRRLVLFVVPPLLWVVALLVVAVVVNRTNAILIGLVIALACLLVSAAGLALLRAGRERELERYVDGR